jgi:cobalamin biosynthesis protein CobD/CbiB
LLSAEDKTLLCWGNALLLLDTLLDARNLWVALCQPVSWWFWNVCIVTERWMRRFFSRMVSYFVVGLNVELNLLAGQGAHSTRT